jgi:ABC-type microcin C transport system permease subunit YejB
MHGGCNATISQCRSVVYVVSACHTLVTLEAIFFMHVFRAAVQIKIQEIW